MLLLGVLSIFVLAMLPSIKFSSMKKSVFYHAGCPVCVNAENEIVDLVGPSNVTVVHLGNQKEEVSKAEAAGVKSVPALVTPNGQVLHINFGASIDALK